jgi:hypothetical protein
MTAKELGIRMLSVVPNNEVFKSSFAVASVRRANLARYYLRAIDLYLMDDPYPQFIPNDDTRAVNIEHVLPVTPGDGWNIASDVAAAFHKRLGNMALLGAQDNVKIGNRPFDAKKKTFEKSPYKTTEMIAEYDEWGPEQITDRQQRLSVYVPKIWPL